MERSATVRGPRATRTLPEGETALVGRDLLFIHGIGADAASWVSLVPYLGRTHTLRFLDLPGHGASDDFPDEGDRLVDSLADTVVAAVEALPSSVVIGNSLGGAISLLLAVRLPSKVQSLFLLSPAGPPLDREVFEGVIGQFDIRTTSQARVFLRKLFATFPYNSVMLAPLILSVWARPGLHRLRLAFSHEGLFSADDVRKFQVPVHLSWGEQDGVLPRQARDWLLEHLPRVERADPADEAKEGHSPQIERPRSVARRILRFVG